MKTQNRAILDYMMQGHAITSLNALNKFGCMRLTSRIHDIKKMGVIVDDEWVKGGNGKKYKRYWISSKERARLQAIWEEGK